MNLITTVIGFGISATFIGFVCTRLICARLRQVEAQQMLENDLRIDPEMPEHLVTGLEPVVVAAIPTVKFNLQAFSSMGDALCSICLAEYQEKEALRIMPKCGHSFHLSCIDTWLRKHSTCPVCRLPIQEDSVETKHVPTPALSAAQSFGSSEVTVEHSQQSPIATVACTEGNGSNQMHADSVSIEVDSGASAATTSRSP